MAEDDLAGKWSVRFRLDAEFIHLILQNPSGNTQHGGGFTLYVIRPFQYVEDDRFLELFFSFCKGYLTIPNLAFYKAGFTDVPNVCGKLFRGDDILIH